MGRRAGSRLIAGAILALAAWTPSSMSNATTAPAPHVIIPPREPLANFRQFNLQHVLAAIDAARASEEGLAPLRFNLMRFRHLSVPEQVFVVSNLERTTRGLYPAVAMRSRLDALATASARRDADPTDVGATYSSVWLGAPAMPGQYAFFADFGWLYDDGPPPQFFFRNLDCVRAGESGCWGHRNNVLSNPLGDGATCAHPKFVTGVGFALGTPYGASVSQIFEVECASGELATDFTWRRAVEYLGIPVSEAGTGRAVAARPRGSSPSSPRERRGTPSGRPSRVTRG